jgi:hypothetical protein
MWSLYAYAARVEEQKFLRSPLAVPYAAYCRRAG